MTKTELDTIIVLLDNCIKEVTMLEYRSNDIDYQKRIAYIRGHLDSGREMYLTMKKNAWR